MGLLPPEEKPHRAQFGQANSRTSDPEILMKIYLRGGGMTSIASCDGSVNPPPPSGWIGQLLAILQRAVFETSWTPWLRIMLTVVVLVLTYIAVKLLAGWPG